MPLLVRRLVERSAFGDTGAGHEGIESAETIDSGLDRCLHLRAVGDIGAVTGDPGQIRVGEVDTDDVVSVGGEPGRDGPADPARGSGDQRGSGHELVTFESGMYTPKKYTIY
ncbi:hypothetical protein GCM10027598_20780 [Amycolatopsis oliviviridis]|uniref:Uncharacterized protein n=1 Tax=Amycolatopsis oliviviridis TaxID=1471590 RepID=A0ABQ3LLF6_9PSEU|nr:hypothetical protein GCM10017790_28430 [Amycolatopsis oliviviridis]